MRVRTVLALTCLGLACWLVSCGERAEPTFIAGSAKADAPMAVVVVDTGAPLWPTARLTNESSDTLYAEWCRSAWWERRDETIPSTEEGWIAAGPAVLQCAGDTRWWSIESQARKGRPIALPTEEATDDPQDRAPAPGVYRLAVAVYDKIGSGARMLTIVRSAALVVADVTSQCQAVCSKVQTCQDSASPAAVFDRQACDVWCRSLLAPAPEAVIDDCGDCFAQQSCADVLLDPTEPYDLLAGNPGACLIECRLGTCEADTDCAEGQSCAYSYDWLTRVETWACKD